MLCPLPSESFCPSPSGKLLGVPGELVVIMCESPIAPICGFALAWLILLPVSRLVRDEVA